MKRKWTNLFVHIWKLEHDMVLGLAFRRIRISPFWLLLFSLYVQACLCIYTTHYLVCICFYDYIKYMNLPCVRVEFSLAHNLSLEFKRQLNCCYEEKKKMQPGVWKLEDSFGILMCFSFLFFYMHIDWSLNSSEGKI